MIKLGLPECNKFLVQTGKVSAKLWFIKKTNAVSAKCSKAEAWLYQCKITGEHCSSVTTVLCLCWFLSPQLSPSCAVRTIPPTSKPILRTTGLLPLPCHRKSWMSSRISELGTPRLEGISLFYVLTFEISRHPLFHAFMISLESIWKWKC